MKHSIRFYIMAAVMLFSWDSFAQSTILWQVSREGISKPSFVLGTYHQVGSSFIDSFPVIREKLLLSDVVIFESGYDNESAAAYYNSREKNEKLKKSLSDEDYKYVTELYRDAKFDFNKLTIGELDLALKATIQSSRYCLDRFKDSVYVDKYLQTLAGQAGKKMVTLEKSEKQFEVINAYTSKFNDKFYTRSIHQTLKRIKEKNPLPADCKMINEYISFKLDYNFNQDCPDAQLSSVRHESWKNEILANLGKGNTFVAVGLFHLYFKCGLIRMLQENGFTVEPVKLK